MHFPPSLLVYNLLIVAAIWLGAFLSMMTHANRKYVRLAVSFSAGIFLGVAFLHMIPDSIHLLGESAAIYVLGGFIFFYVLERFVMTHPCEEDHCDYHSIGFAAFSGLSIHSLMNGLALGSAMLVPGLGFTIFLATVVHKAPESFSLSSLMVLGKLPKKLIYKYIALLSVMVPAGTVLAYWGMAGVGEHVIGMAVAISAGMFLQIATGDLLPETHSSNENRWWALGTFLFGVGVAILTRMMEHT